MLHLLGNKNTLIKKLKGAQLNVLTRLIYYQTNEVNLEGINTKELSKKCNTSYYNTKTALHRLCSKKLVKRLKGKKAWYGFIKFYVFKETIASYNDQFLEYFNSIYNNSNYITNITIDENKKKNNHKDKEVIDNLSEFKLDQNNSKNTNNNCLKENNTDFSNLTSHQSESTTPSNADPESRNKKLTYDQLPEEWQNINYHLIEDLHFKPHHLITLYKLNALGPETIDESIRHFAYGIRHNPDNYKKYTDPLKVFYGSLRKGRPWTESTYKSTKEIATEELIQQKKQAKRKLADQQCELIDNLEKETYSKWYLSLTDEQKKEIREEHSRKHNNIYSYYDEKIFKLHYSKEVMTEYQDPKEKALAEYLEKKKEQMQNEVRRITEMLQKTGATKEYFAWLDKQTNDELGKITERKNFTHETMTQEEGDILKVYFAKNILINKKNSQEK